jgi:glyoxylase-like metal-dependent hydrolase (beta-lactamase superfamily II)
MSRILTASALSLLAAACAPKSTTGLDSAAAADEAPTREAPASEAPASEASAPVVHRWQSGESGFHTNSWWIDTGAEVVVFDAQFTPELADALVAEIHAATDSPITTLVITHPNPDKFNGAPVFQDLGATVVASAATLAALPGVHAYKEAYFTGVGMFEAGAYPALPAVDQIFETELTLELAGTDLPLELSVLDHGGVTTTQTVARIGDDVFVGDLVAEQTHAWLEGGIVDGAARPDLGAWSAALDETLALVGPDAVVHPGRGAAAPAGVVLPAQRDYLADAEEIVRAVLAEEADPVAALSGEQAGAVYGRITEQLAAAHPGHAHAYLVTYGVYGLALDIAAER